MNNAKKYRKIIEWKKNRDFFKKIRDIKGMFHAKMDTIKERKVMYLTEAEEIRKR